MVSKLGALASEARTTSSNGGAINTRSAKKLLVGIDLTALVSTGITFTVQFLGADDAWYDLITFDEMTAPGQKVAAIGEGQDYNYPVPAQIRIKWVLNGAGGGTFSYSVQGE